MLIDCPEMALYRNKCSLGLFVNSYRRMHPHISAVKLYALYLNDFITNEHKERILNLYHMKLGWHTQMGINL